jgi:biopolymer transport protein ExbD
MKTSKRARRIERRNKMLKPAALNIVSLMDIFTILVFFLLVNSSSQQLPSKKDITLPESVAETMPEETVNVMVTKREVMVDGRVIVLLKDISEQEAVITALKNELEYQASLDASGNKVKSLTIMADENLPYSLVDKVLKTCQQVSYRKIAFAVTQIENKGKAGSGQ